MRGDHAKLIRKLAAEATILLKNEKQALPLKSPKNIAIFGNDAGENTMGAVSQDPFVFGNLAAGGGSGTGRFTYLKSRAIMWRS